MAQILVDSSPIGRTVRWFVKYTQADKRNNVTCSEISQFAADFLNTGSLPCLILEGDGAPFKSNSLFGVLHFICNVTGFKDIFLGKDFDQFEIMSFIETCALVSEDDLIEKLEEHLKERVFLVGSHISLADLFVFSQLIETIRGWEDKIKVTYANTFRWADHMQHLPYLE